ncbi:MAG: hypothetical protein WC648_00025 [Candidatus Paceibacterota bacterium]|jgi:hypothetical protein
MTKTIVKTYSAIHEYSHKIVNIFFFIGAFLLLLYAMNVYSVISRTVALQNTQAEIVTATKTIEELDSKYLKLASNVTPDDLRSFGLKEGVVSAYISRTLPLSRVALVTHEL